LVTERKWWGFFAERRHREAGGELAVDLTLRGACADRSPRDQIGVELRRDRIEKLRPRGKLEGDDIEEEAPRGPEPLVDREAAVEVRIVDEPLPAHRRARLLEVHAHHDVERLGERASRLRETGRVLEGGVGVVDRARSDDHQQPVAPGPERLGDLLTGLGDGGGAPLVERQILHEDRRSDQRPEVLDAEVRRYMLRLEV
jgi:hypothetical protein